MKKMSIGKTSAKNVKSVRQAVYDRDNNECVVYQTEWSLKSPCAGILTIQHAVGRGMGGSKKWDRPEYLRTMCAHHNTLQTADADFDNYCKKVAGWAIPRWAAETFPVGRIPVLYKDGYYLLFGEERSRINSEVALDLLQEIYGEEL